jgi:hypothetical protein
MPEVRSVVLSVFAVTLYQAQRYALFLLSGTLCFPEQLVHELRDDLGFGRHRDEVSLSHRPAPVKSYKVRLHPSLLLLLLLSMQRQGAFY